MTRRAAERWMWVVAAIAVIGSALCWKFWPTDFAFAWLAAFTCWLGWPLGSLALALVHALTGGRWGDAIRPKLAASIMTLPLAAAAVIPILLAMPVLYPWSHPEAARQLQNAPYLNVPFFL